MNKKIITYASIIILVVGLVFLANGLVLAWTWPSSNPTGGNVAPPLSHPDAAFNSEGRLNIDGGADYWIGKYWNSFTLHNDNLYRRLTLGQDGALEIRGGSLTGDSILFSVDTNGYAAADRFMEQSDSSKYIDPAGLSKLNDLDADVISATKYNDINNTSYYLNPAEGSVLNGVTMSRMDFNGQTGDTCMFFQGCPTGWTNKGQIGFIADPAKCPYVVGAYHAPGWYWCHPYLCCR